MTLNATQRATQALQRFARREPAASGASHAHAAIEQCELCGAPVAAGHAHLLEAKSRSIRCACAACALLFDDGGSEQRYRRLNGHVASLPSAALDADDLAALGVPVRLVFLCPSRTHQALFMLYPSAAGPIEAQSSWLAWQTLVARHAALAAVEPDRDAVIVDRRAGSARTPLHVSLDIAYELLGSLRGSEAGSRFASFEARLEQLCRHGGAHG